MSDSSATLPASGRIEIPVSHGHLEGILRQSADPFAAVVVCHPHPLFGGTMNNNVVFRASKALVEAGASVLRFNFRGVGQSTGRYADGIGEEDDALAALDLMAAHNPETPLWMAGFSFGARVGLTVGEREPRVQKLFGIGLALKLFDYSFLTASRKPKAFIQADNDEFGPAPQIRELVDAMAQPKRLFMVENAIHLFPGRLDQLEQAADSAVRYLRDQGPESPTEP